MPLLLLGVSAGLVVGGGSARGQAGGGTGRSPASGSSTGASNSAGASNAAAGTVDAVSRTVSGRVIDAIRGTPVPRALVRLNSRAVLTDSLGRFSFAEFAEAQGSASVNKPGYAATADGSQGLSAVKIADLDAPVELQLYPDALVTGVVTGRDGQPLRRVQLSLYRASYTPLGLVPQDVGFASTDSHGQFRFQQPAGRFRVALRYTAQMPEAGQAVLPATVPSEAFDSPLGFVAVGPGQERHFELRADTGTAYPVSLRADGVSSNEGRRGGGGVRVTVQTQNGESFQTQASGTGIAGEFVLTLPAGTYAVKVESQGRAETEEGSVRVTVPVRDGSSIPVHLTPLTEFPIELGTEVSTAAPASGSTSGLTLTTAVQPPTLPQLNLQLYNSLDPLNNADMRPRTGADQTYSFRAPAGRYRLTAPGTGTWTVRSASIGSTNLMTDELVVSDGASGTPMRLIVGNDTGRLSGTVQMPTGQAPGWVYLLPRQPSLTAYWMQRINTDGTFSRSLPVGSYTVFAVPDRLQVDLRDPRVAGPFASAGSTADITANGTSTVTLAMTLPAGAVQ